MKNIFILLTLSSLASFVQVELLFSKNLADTTEKTSEKRNVIKAKTAPSIDGKKEDLCWVEPKWNSLDQRWIGEKYDIKDFSGRYKLTWDEQALYLLVQVIDDKLVDQYPDPLKLWWDDDCVEIFIDADNSGGNHLHNHNAFAYHVALDHNVVDLSSKKEPILFNEHIETKHITQGTTTIWEHKIHLFDEASYNEDSNENTPLKLIANQEVGFALAYCDNDGSKERENFIGSVFVPGDDKNQGYKTADIFETIVLTE